MLVVSACRLVPSATGSCDHLLPAANLHHCQSFALTGGSCDRFEAGTVKSAMGQGRPGGAAFLIRDPGPVSDGEGARCCRVAWSLPSGSWICATAPFPLPDAPRCAESRRHRVKVDAVRGDR